MKVPAAPSRPGPITLTSRDRWVSCSIENYGSVGSTRHIIRAGGTTTYCGCTASHPAVWEPNTTKARCLDCIARYPRPDGTTARGARGLVPHTREP